MFSNDFMLVTTTNTRDPTPAEIRIAVPQTEYGSEGKIFGVPSFAGIVMARGNLLGKLAYLEKCTRVDRHTKLHASREQEDRECQENEPT
ncbi:MAG: hypothetical protein ACXV8X_04635 [Candidatus Angelobacter sp.]